MNKLQKYFRYLYTDFWGGLFHIGWILYRNYIPYFYSPYCLWLLIKGIRIKGFVRFRGAPLFKRHPNSQIVIGKGCVFVSSSLSNFRGISHCCIIQTGAEGAEINIGNNCGFSGCSIVADKKVHIGNNVTVGADVMIGDRDDHSELYASEPIPVVVEDNVWIGMRCIVLKGVTIGKNSVIGAGSIVTKDIPANSVAVGVPCKVIKYRS